MNVQSFLDHWGLSDNPFRAEEAKDDPIFKRMMQGGMPHPDFEKIYGDPANPSPAVVFGEKGSGKTAMRLQTIQRLQEYNKSHPDKKLWVVSYDDLNPILDRYTARLQKLGRKDVQLSEIRLEDHMDAILSISVTQLMDRLLNGEGDEALSSRKMRRKFRSASAQRRKDLAELALLYDQPSNDESTSRWNKVRKLLGFGQVRWLNISLALGLVLTVFALIFAGGIFLYTLTSWQTLAGLLLTCAGGFILLSGCLKRRLKARKMARQIYKEILVTDRSIPQLIDRIGNLPGKGIQGQPIPLAGDQDSRYQLMHRFLEILKDADYAGMIVLIDRIDEPTLIKGDPNRMRAVVWPLLDNKFLQMPGIGVKLLLPIELRHLLRREDAAFYQKARLDKQQMIDHLEWSGAILYDLCNQRIAACQKPGRERLALRDLFEESVSQQDLTDALDQMHQPRDAFKMIYQVIQEHCMLHSDQDNLWNIPRTTLEHVRREQSQRVQDLYRGLGPA